MDASRDQDVRRALHKLARLAERQNFAVVCLRHLNKASGDKAIYRGGGSIGIVAAAGAACSRRPDPDDRQRRVIGRDEVQSGGAAAAAAVRPGAVRRRLPGGVAGRGGLQADELVRRLSRAERAEREEVRGMLDEAMDFLRDLLATGPKPRSMRYLTGQAAGYSRRTLERAVHVLGLVTDFGGPNAVGEATYELPPTPGGAEAGGLADEA